MLTLNNLNKTYKDHKILDDISFIFPDKGLVLLKGENGSGKTTLLNLISLNDSAYKGDIIINGINAKKMSSIKKQSIKRHLICYISQKNNLFTFLSDAENIYFADLCANKKILNKGRKINSLSEGEQMKCSLERALRTKKSIYIFDEVFSPLDQKNQKYYFDKIKELKEKSLVIIVSHFLNSYDDFDVILNLKKGKLEIIKNNLLPSENSIVAKPLSFKPEIKLRYKLFLKSFTSNIKQKISYFIISFLCLAFLVGATGTLLMKPSAALIQEVKDLPVIAFGVNQTGSKVLIDEYQDKIEYLNPDYSISTTNYRFTFNVLIDEDIKDGKFHLNETLYNYLKVEFGVTSLTDCINELTDLPVELVIDESIKRNCIYSGANYKNKIKACYLWIDNDIKNDVFSTISNNYMNFSFIENYTLYDFSKYEDVCQEIKNSIQSMNIISRERYEYKNKMRLITLAIFLLVLYIFISLILVQSIKRNESKNIKLLNRFGFQRIEINGIIYGPYIMLHLIALGLSKALSYYLFPTKDYFEFVVWVIPENIILYLILTFFVWFMTYLYSGWKENGKYKF